MSIQTHLRVELQAQGNNSNFVDAGGLLGPETLIQGHLAMVHELEGDLDAAHAHERELNAHVQTLQEQLDSERASDRLSIALHEKARLVSEVDDLMSYVSELNAEVKALKNKNALDLPVSISALTVQ